MIVLEGADCVGKTTLAQELFRRIPIESAGQFNPMVRHFTKPPEHFNRYWGYRNCIQRDVILDRFHMSQIAYREAERATHDLDPFRYQLLDAEILKAGGVVVVITASDETIQHRWGSAPPERQEMYTLEHVLKVNTEFQYILTSQPYTAKNGSYRPEVTLEFDSSKTSTKDMAEEIMSEWFERQTQLDLIISENLASNNSL